MTFFNENLSPFNWNVPLWDVCSRLCFYDANPKKIGTVLSLGDAVAKAKECYDGNEKSLKNKLQL